MNKIEIRDKLFRCAENALCCFVVWSRDRPEESITVPIQTVEHMRRVIGKMYDLYKDQVTEKASSRTYFIHIENDKTFHPVYIIGTILVLLLADVKKIWIDYPCCYRRDYAQLRNPEITFFIEEVIKKFDNVQAIDRTNGKQKDAYTIRFVEEHPEISHVVDLGRQVDCYERLKAYRKDIYIHIPATNFVWLDYESMEEIEQDEKLLQFAQRCDQGVFDYECFTDGLYKELEKIGFSTGNIYNNYDWYAFLEEFVEWRLMTNVSDTIPIFCFGKTKNRNVWENYKNFTRMIDGDNINVNQIYYDFTDILRERLW